MTHNLPNPDDVTFLPPHEPTPVPGFHAYSHRMGLRPGQTLDVRVSNEGPVRIQIVRHGAAVGVDETVIAELPRAEATLHPVHRGSYLFVERGLESISPLTVETWVRPLADGGRMGLFDQAGLHLSLAKGLIPTFAVDTDRGRFEATGPALTLVQWHHIVGHFDGQSLRLFVDGKQAGDAVRVDGKYHSTPGPLLLGAQLNERGQASSILTGDLCAPSLYNAALPPELIARRFAEKTLTPARGCVGHWKFDSLDGKKPCRDASSARRHASPVNYPIRMIPGPRRTEDSDWCTYDPVSDSDFGYAIRLLPDALVDCRWPVTVEWKLPRNLKTGQYAAKVINTAGESRYVDFIVRPAKPTAKLACLSTTNTRVAYNFQPFNIRELDYGAYQNHSSVAMLGHILGARRPTGGSWSRTTVDFELPFYAWLDKQNIAYDLYTEWDLEADPSLLDHYKVVAWAGHSEYWTAAQYESLQKFLHKGGRLLSMSGNTAFWRVSVDFKNDAIEVRKHDRVMQPGVSAGPMFFAAHHHQSDHLPGSFMHLAGWPQVGIGVGLTGGYTDPPLNGPRAGYEVLEPNHALFQSPRRINTAGVFAPDAAGYEMDASLRSMIKNFGEPKSPQYPPRDGSPKPTLAGDQSQGPLILARARVPKCHVIDHDVTYYPPDKGKEMWSEMLYKEHPGGGITFACGSVLSGDVLLRDENFSNFILNVLDKMGGR